MDAELPEQIIKVSQAERWMDREIKVELTVQITSMTSSTQTFYVSEDEASKLVSELNYYLKGKGKN